VKRGKENKREKTKNLKEKLSHLRVGYLNHFNANTNDSVRSRLGGDKKV
jgi:hypothetical protein